MAKWLILDGRPAIPTVPICSCRSSVYPEQTEKFFTALAEIGIEACHVPEVIHLPSCGWLYRYSQAGFAVLPIATGIRTRSYRHQPPWVKPSKRSIGGRSSSGLAKVISSPWILFQSPWGLFIAASGGTRVVFCTLSSISGGLLPLAILYR